ncbi:MFS transporter [Cohnella zeiphila]|uniref:MFS transporter n=1 Tax=Cohnella zeiphila TaxID=2761120 RepID=A0A7X0VXL5_9BACL|nr:MFS transporter [Cohnella zeiphila]MBB6733735.1 MFS transporter [Cohnella zeiphila]
MQPSELAIAAKRDRPVSAEGFTLSLLLLFAFEFVRGAFLVSYLPGIGHDRLHLSAAVIGLAVSIHYLADSALKLIAGYVLERVPARFTLFGGAVLMAAGFGLASHSSSPGLLYAAMAAAGIGSSPVWLVGVSRLDKDKRAEQMGILYLCWMGGLGLGPVLINFALDAGYSLSLALLMGLTAIAGFAALRLPQGAKASFDRLDFREQAALLKERARRMGPLMAVMILQSLSGSMLVPLLTPFATAHFGWSHAALSAVMITGGACAVGLLIPMGKLTDRIGGKRFLIVGCGLFAAAVAAVPSAGRLVQAAVLAAVLGASYAAFLPAWNAELAKHVPDQAQGTGWGLISTIEGAGAMAGPVLGGWVAQRFGDAVPFYICGAVFALLSVYFLSSCGLKARNSS